jgi:hypothetical protein
MNPNSSYYLAFNTGFPNAYDRAWGRTGSDLMVHGDCSSRGCYAMTDEQIGEIYALAREAFFGGQRSFQLEAFPFRMTPLNMARHRNNPNMPFWKMLKEGYDHFEVTHLEPKVDVCERRYVFDAERPSGSSTPISFSPSGKCPTYQVPPDIQTAVAEKEQQDETQMAALVSRGVATAPVRTGTDGGMNPVFLAALTQHQQTFAAREDELGETRTPSGTIPPTVNPPHVAQIAYSSESTSPAMAPTIGAMRSTSVATAGASGTGLFDRMAKAMGMRTPAASASAPTVLVGKPTPPSRAKTVASRETPKPVQHVAAVPEKAALAAPAHPASSPKPDLRGTTAAATPKPAPAENRPTPPANATAMVAPTNTISGAQAVVPTGSFESRWSGVR